MESKEQKWMKKIKQGNRRAFKQLFNHYSDYAHRIAYAMMKNPHDAADVVQETFIKMFRYAETFQENQPFQPWFYRILVNEAKRLLKKKSNEATQMETEKMDFFHQSSETGAIDDLAIAMEQLQEHERTILVLKYIQSFSEKEIAAMLELNVNTVKTRLYRARQKLKSIMERMGYDV